MVKESSSGQTKAHIMETSFKTISMDKASINGPMVESTMANGLTIKWKDKELSLGVTVEDTKEITKMIKSMVMVHSNGQMVENT